MLIIYYYTVINEFKLLNEPKQKYIFAVKLIVSNLIPNNIKKSVRSRLI